MTQHDQHAPQGRTSGSGPAAVLHLRPLRPVIAAVVLALGASACGGSPRRAAGFGGFPAFLPKGTVQSGAAHRIVDASASQPALAAQGDTVRVHLGGTSESAVLVTVTGPEVPNEGLPYQAPTSPATWLLTLSGATAAVPLDPATFQAVDSAGRVYDLSVVPGRPVPRQVAPGETVSFGLSTTSFAVGQGRLRWIPSGHLAPVEWDFTVETD